jgi:uncharacterized protein
MIHRPHCRSNMHKLALLCSGVIAAATAAAAPLALVTGSERGTYIQIGRDLSSLVAKPAGLELTPLVSEGSASNVHRLRKEPGVRLALVQSDVYQAYLDEAKAGNASAKDLIRPLRVVLPLYDEEIYFVVRADSPLNFIHEIENKRINVGPVGSGTALTATTLYRQMFGDGMNGANTSHLRNEDALLKLATDTTLDVAIIVAGQPAKLFSEMKPEARQYIRLLRLDSAAPQAVAALKSYQAASIRTASYPNWLGEDVPTLTTKALLVTYDYSLTSGVQQQLTRFARSLCSNMQRLRSEGHPKWQEVSFKLPPLGAGWSYYRATSRELAGCEAAQAALGAAAAQSAAVETAVAASCTQDRKMLGLCGAAATVKR